MQRRMPFTLSALVAILFGNGASAETVRGSEWSSNLIGQMTQNQGMLEGDPEFSPPPQAVNDQAFVDMGSNNKPPSALLEYDLSSLPNAYGAKYKAWYAEMEVKSEYSPGTYFALTKMNAGYGGIQTLPGAPFQFIGMAIFSIWDHGCNSLMDGCPPERHAEVLATGERVRLKRFKGEGTGYMARVETWEMHTGGHKTMFEGEKLSMLVTAEANGTDHAIYTGYFNIPTLSNRVRSEGYNMIGVDDDVHREQICPKGWCLLAKIRIKIDGGSLPNGAKYHQMPWNLHGLQSFVEHFLPLSVPRLSGTNGLEMYYTEKAADFGPAWVCDESGQWEQIKNAHFQKRPWPHSDSKAACGKVSADGQQWSLDICKEECDDRISNLNVGTANEVMSPEFQNVKYLYENGMLPAGCAGAFCPAPLNFFFFKWYPPACINWFRQWFHGYRGIVMWYIVTVVIMCCGCCCAIRLCCKLKEKLKGDSNKEYAGYAPAGESDPRGFLAQSAPLAGQDCTMNKVGPSMYSNSAPPGMYTR